MKFKSYYVNPPKTVVFTPDTETKWIDQSEADRASLSYQLERYGMSGIAQQFEKMKAQFGYADTRFSKSFADLSLKMQEANEYFQQLPAKIRKLYEHDCVKYFDAIEKNPKEMYDLGHISKELAKDLGVKFEVETPIPVSEPIKDTVTEEIKQEG